MMNDLISRQAVRLIESDSNAYPEVWNESYEKGFCDAINRVLDLPPSQPERKTREWIPCSERLPEYGESVLCYFEEGEDFGVNHVIDEEDGEWFIDGVTAWMPLPEPYKGGENDTL